MNLADAISQVAGVLHDLNSGRVTELPEHVLAQKEGRRVLSSFEQQVQLYKSRLQWWEKRWGGLSAPRSMGHKNPKIELAQVHKLLSIKDLCGHTIILEGKLALDLMAREPPVFHVYFSIDDTILLRQLEEKLKGLVPKSDEKTYKSFLRVTKEQHGIVRIYPNKYTRLKYTRLLQFNAVSDSGTVSNDTSPAVTWQEREVTDTIGPDAFERGSFSRFWSVLQIHSSSVRFSCLCALLTVPSLL